MVGLKSEVGEWDDGVLDSTEVGRPKWCGAEPPLARRILDRLPDLQDSKLSDFILSVD